MNDFLNELASRKWRYYQFLHKKQPQAYTSADCYERIKINTAYLEVLDIINYLSPKERQIVNARFVELTEFF